MKAHCLPFTQIPHTTRLFSDFLAYSPRVRPFYPHSPNFSEWLKEEASALRYEGARREGVSAILERQNRSWNASPQTLANLGRLRQGAAAVVTGQQVGLFGGPMFAVYKALTAVKLAEEAGKAGVDAVPVFWLATSDHDLAEVNHVTFLGADGALQAIATTSHDVTGAPVSAVRLGEEILPAVEQAAALLGETDATRILREAYRPGESLGTAFARLYARLFADWGVILLDASDPELHRVAEPIYRSAIEHAEKLNGALLARGEALERAGYHQQVKVVPSTVLLFTLHEGARTPIHRLAGEQADEKNVFVIEHKDGAERVTEDALLAQIAAAPEKFSPNVLLRPVVQDYLLPTLAYAGGAAEAAYFSQAGAVYEAVLGRVTAVVPRFSATLIEPKMQRLLERYGIGLRDVLNGPEALRQELAARSLPGELQSAFDAAKQSLESNLAAIREKLERLDRTLVEAAQTAGSKMHYHLDRLYAQAARAESQKGEVVGRHAETLSQALFPDKGLQERGIGGMAFIARYGLGFLQQLYEGMQTDCHDHQVIEL
ncbi:MAG TPA: bacillithiol biosynthesis cysteine-adding enzyme BshC [Candidatus Sulfotelmatobacter sp.]